MYKRFLHCWARGTIIQRLIVLKGIRQMWRVLLTISVVLMVLVACAKVASDPLPSTTAPTTPPVSTDTPLPTFPQNTSEPTSTATPQPTITSSPTSSSDDCTWAAVYVADVTIPDGTRVTLDERFTKTWRVRNTGDCVWNDVVLRFVGGFQMTIKNEVTVSKTYPQREVDVTVDLVAPAEPGNYQGVWALCRDEECFYDLTVQIVAGGPVVAEPTSTVVEVASPIPPTHAPTQAPAPTSPPSSPGYPAGVWLCPGSTEGAAYVGSVESDKFHYPNCRWAKKIEAGNRLCFTSREAAVGFGYVPCGTCNP